MKKVIVVSGENGQNFKLSENLNEVYRDGYLKSEIVISNDIMSKNKGLIALKQYIIEHKSIERVYINQLSQLGNDSKALLRIKDFLCSNKIQLVCLKPFFKLLDDDGRISKKGLLVFSICSSFIESENEIMKEKISRCSNGKVETQSTIPLPQLKLLIKNSLIEMYNELKKDTMIKSIN